MIRVLLDTNVILDALLDREPWAADAKRIWAAHLEKQLAAHVTATSLAETQPGGAELH
jgi:predicted nucleic acid-binding protein